MFRTERPLSEGSLRDIVLEYASRPRSRAPARHRHARGSRPAAFPRAVLGRGPSGTRVRARARHAPGDGMHRVGSQGTVQSYSVDLSGGGMLLAGPEHAEDRRARRFPPDDDARQRADPRQRHGGAHRRAGTPRDLLRSRSARAIIAGSVRFIFECQRAERRRGLEQEEGHGDAETDRPRRSPRLRVRRSKALTPRATPRPGRPRRPKKAKEPKKDQAQAGHCRRGGLGPEHRRASARRARRRARPRVGAVSSGSWWVGISHCRRTPSPASACTR